MKRAYSLLSITKSFEDGEERVIEGIASTPTADRMGDVVEPMGAKFKLPMPLLWQHDHEKPVGHVEFAQPTKSGIPFRARIVKIDEPGILKDRTDEAWHSLKSGVVSAVSIGFAAHDYEAMPNGGLRFKEWEWYELSLVTIPANAEATINVVRSLDRAALAATGKSKARGVKLKSAAGVSAANTNPKPNATTEQKMKTLKEQLEVIRANRQEKAARMASLLEKSLEVGETLAGAEADEFADLENEVSQLDEQVKRLETLERIQAKSAAPVAGASAASASAARAGVHAVQLKEKQAPGIEFARYVGVLAAAKGNTVQALEIAKSRFPNQEKLHHVIRAAVSAGTTTDPTWAGNLVEYSTMANDFLEFLRPQTILGKFGQGNVPGLRNVPFNVRIRSQIAGTSAQWVGEGQTKPVTKAGYDVTQLGFAKVAAISVLTDELLRFSSPSAEALIRDELARGIVARLDEDFVNPDKAAVAGVSPASITNGATTVASSGATLAAINADIRAAFSAFIVANVDPTRAVWIMDGVTALAISTVRNELGAKAFPEMSMFGGTLEGLPVIVSQYVPLDVNSKHMIALVNTSDILLADDGQVVVDASREATLEMLDSGFTGTATHNLWQHNEVAFRAERFINWGRARSSAVVVITGVSYNA